MGRDDIEVLAAVVDAARRELADRDPEQVPPRLRRIARASSGRLPPPLAVSLLDVIATNEAFRTSVRERLEADGGTDALTEAYLTDPDAAQPLVIAAREARMAEKRTKQLEAVSNDRDRLAARLAEAKRRLDDTRTRCEGEIDKAKAAADDANRALRRRVGDLERQLVAAEKRVGDLEARVGDVEAERDAAEGRLARFVAKSRTRSQAGEAPQRPAPPSPPADPIARAAWLDAMERVTRPYREPSLEAVADVSVGIRVPVGVRPDEREIIDALIEQAGAVFVVDGYNLAGHLVPKPAQPTERRQAALRSVDRLAMRSRGRVVVVFDAVGVEGRSSLHTDAGVEVVFTYATDADDAIVAMADAQPEATVVVTDDRELRARVEAVGAMAVWSAALAEWSNA